MMRVGTSILDITPEPGCELSGYVARVQPSVGVVDSLFARALFLQNGESGILWLHTDLIGLEREFVSRARTAISVRTGLPESSILFSSTHTHSGPASIHLTNCGEYNGTYLETLLSRLLTAAEVAMTSHEPVRVEFGEGKCELAVDRRKKATAHTDPRVGIVAWRRPDGSYAAILANYAMHNVGWGSDNRMISADIFGSAARQLSAQLPGDPVVLFTNGACGNTNPPEHAKSVPEIDDWARHLVLSVKTSLDDCAIEADGILKSEIETVPLPLDIPTAVQVRECAARLREDMEGQTGYVADRVRHTADLWEKVMLEKVARNELTREALLDLQVVQIGPVSFVGMGAEAFSRIACDLRSSSRQNAYVVGYANGLTGYLPTPEAYDEGGYEVERAFIYYNSFRPRKEAFEIVRDTAIRMLASI